MNNKFCAMLSRACEYSDRCKHSPRQSTTGLLHAQFFVPNSTGEFCNHYQPLGGSDDKSND